MELNPMISRSRMGRRQAFGDIHEGAGLSQEDIEHLRQVYISACLTGIHSRPPHNVHRSQIYESDYDTTYAMNRAARQRSVPAVLNELSMDSRLIKFLETKGHSASSAMIVRIPADQVSRNKSDGNTTKAGNETNFIDMLTQKLSEQATIQSGNTGSEESTNDGDLTASKVQRRLDNLDVLNSPRFGQRRFALGNILDSVDVRKLRKQLSVPSDLGTQPFFQFAVPEVSPPKVTQMGASLAF